MGLSNIKIETDEDIIPVYDNADISFKAYSLQHDYRQEYTTDNQKLDLYDSNNCKQDAVNNPKHYNSHPSGIDCLTITEHMTFNLGNAIKYIWRADLKGKQIEDLQKAVFYLNREISRITKNKEK